MKFNKLVGALALAAATFAFSAQAADEAAPKRLTGGGSNIIYVITPTHSSRLSRMSL